MKEDFSKDLDKLIELVRSSERCQKIGPPYVEYFTIEDAIKYREQKSEIDYKIKYLKNNILKNIERLKNA